MQLSNDDANQNHSYCENAALGIFYGCYESSDDSFGTIPSFTNKPSEVNFKSLGIMDQYLNFIS